MKPEDLVQKALFKGLGDAFLLSLEHDDEFYEEFMNIFIHKLKHGPNSEQWVEELKNALEN